jgi:hypothetical protein
MTVTVNDELRSEFLRNFEAKSRAEGQSRSVLAVLATRGVDVSDDDAARISSCTDTDVLYVWLCRAVTAETVADLFKA